MFQVNSVRSVRTEAANQRSPAAAGGAVLLHMNGRQQTTPLYHWLGADAERVAASAGKAAIGPQPATSRAQRTIPLYHWLGAEAEGMAAQAGSTRN
jgi:hypothetical protein